MIKEKYIQFLLFQQMREIIIIGVVHKLVIIITKTKLMKQILLFILITLFLSCSYKEKSLSEKYLNLNWNNGEKIVFENGDIHSYTHFDSIQNKMVGDSLITFLIKDSTIIVTKIIGKGKYEEVNGEYKFKIESDTIDTDTLRFEFRNFNGSKLLLYRKEWYYPSIFNLDKNENQDLQEIKYFDNVRFEIGGLSIGDTISRKDFQFEDVRNYDTYSFEEAELKSNKNINIDIIGDKYILKIIQRGISKYDLDDVIKVVSTKLNQEPKHTPTKKDSEYESEYYRWYKNGTGISLQRMKYIGNDHWKKIYSNDDWDLYYEDKIIETLLINEFKNGQPKSLIIK